MTKFPVSPLLASAWMACLLLTACSPKYDWREVRGEGAPFLVVLPAKPLSHTRTIDLGGVQAAMTMTAAEAEGATFAVGSAELPDAAHAQKAILSMKTALVRNIGGTIRREKASAAGAVPTTIDIEASGPPSTDSDGQGRLLLARFIAQDKRVYQLVVLGKEKDIERDAADTFFTSFKLN